MTTAHAPATNGAVRIVLPREHGATAMLLTPFIASAILLRGFYWPELVALIAISAAMALKDPLVVLARQRLVWKQEHAETPAAKQTAAILTPLLLGCGIVLLLSGDWRPWVPFALGVAAFGALTIAVNVRNKQRSEWFQVASALALSSSCLVACLSTLGRIPDWGWMLWLLCTLQAVAGIFVVHSRLNARIALRTGAKSQNQTRRAAYYSQAAILISAAVFALLGRFWIAAGLTVTAICYLAELQRQKQPASLQIPLTRVGLQTLAQSTAYTLIIIVGLWNR